MSVESQPYSGSLCSKSMRYLATIWMARLLIKPVRCSNFDEADGTFPVG